MKLEYRIRVLAGTMVLASLALGHWVSPWWLLLAAFVAVNLIQSAFTGFCPACGILRRLFPDSPGACGCDEAKGSSCGCDSASGSGPTGKPGDSCGCGKH
jgi:hypothetical protein